MSSLQIQLNGSNLISEKRKQASMNALDDELIAESKEDYLKGPGGEGNIKQ